MIWLIFPELTTGYIAGAQVRTFGKLLQQLYGDRTRTNPQPDQQRPNSKPSDVAN